MRTIWQFSIQTEVEQLVHCAHQIASGFYKVNNLMVLPYNPKRPYSSAVFFPDLIYGEIPRFWSQAKKVDIRHLPLNLPPDFIKQTTALIEKSNIRPPDYQNTEKLWRRVQSEILSEIYKIIPSKENLIKEIVIHPTAFGAPASFNRFNIQAGKIIIYLRQDQGIDTIAEAVITSLTRDEIYRDLGGMWPESEIITDWIIAKSSLNQILQRHGGADDFLPTIKSARTKQQAKLRSESEKFSKKLGFPITDKIFSLKGKTPKVHRRPLVNLSPWENTLLSLLIKKSGEVVSFDEIGERLFFNEDSFSLYAISKAIQRLRDKLEQNGISGAYIQTWRGQGYLLRN